MIVTACGIYSRAKDLLPHYYKHYASMGVDRFYFGIYGDKNSHLWEEVKEFGHGKDIVVFQASEDSILEMEVERKIQDQVRSMLHETDWFVPTDLDELHAIEGYSSFQQLQKDCESENADYVWAATCDRITADGTVPPSIDPSISIWEQFPRNCNLTSHVVWGCFTKIMMARSVVTIYAGHHEAYPTGKYKEFSKRGITYHFKWFGDLRGREVAKVNDFAQRNYQWIDENKRVIEFLDSHGGKLL
jgi:hypothetical protein